jgi:predicted nucleic acid-binding protein
MSVPRLVDTNALLYSISQDPGVVSKREIAIGRLDADDLALSVQVLQEFYRPGDPPPPVTTPLATTSPRASSAPGCASGCGTSGRPIVLGALEIKGQHGLPYWEAAMVAAARALGREELWSEDMRHGRLVDGVVMCDPFR